MMTCRPSSFTAFRTRSREGLSVVQYCTMALSSSMSDFNASFHKIGVLPYFFSIFITRFVK